MDSISTIRPFYVLSYLGMVVLAIFLLVMISACQTTVERHMSPEFGRCVSAGVEAQILNPHAPRDPSSAASMPGDLAQQIYNKRYVKTMTEEKKKGEDTASQLSGLRH